MRVSCNHLFTTDLPKIINNTSKTFVFVDDTSVIVINPNPLTLKITFLQ